MPRHPCPWLGLIAITLRFPAFTGHTDFSTTDMRDFILQGRWMDGCMSVTKAHYE